MLRLRKLMVLTGTLALKGGETHRGRRVTSRTGEVATVTQEHTVTADRRRANVLFVDVMRKLKRLRLLKTPFGTLINPRDTPAVMDVLMQATKGCEEFNASSKTCEALNCLLLEPLQGVRQAALEGWVARQLKQGNAEVQRQLAPFMLTDATAATTVSTAV